MPESSDTSVDLGRVLVIVPTYNERESLPQITARIRASVPSAHILIVDDKPNIISQLKDIFSRSEWVCKSAHDEESAIAICNQSSFSSILISMALPEKLNVIPVVPVLGLQQGTVG